MISNSASNREVTIPFEAKKSAVRLTISPIVGGLEGASVLEFTMRVVCVALQAIKRSGCGEANGQNGHYGRHGLHGLRSDRRRGARFQLLRFLAVVLAAGAILPAGAGYAASPDVTSAAHVIQQQLRGRRVFLTNCEQAVTISADDLTSTAIARGFASADSLAEKRIVRVSARITNVAGKSAQPAQFFLSSGDASLPPAPLNPNENLLRKFHTSDSFDDVLPTSSTRTLYRFYVIAPESVSVARACINDSGAIMWMPLPRLMTLSGLRRIE